MSLTQFKDGSNQINSFYFLFLSLTIITDWKKLESIYAISKHFN
jgi:hypothetical protein